MVAVAEKRTLRNSATTLLSGHKLKGLYTQRAILQTIKDLADSKLVKELTTAGLAAAATTFFAPEMTMIISAIGALSAKIALDRENNLVNSSKSMFSRTKDLANLPVELISNLISSLASKGIETTNTKIEEIEGLESGEEETDKGMSDEEEVR